MSGKASEQLRVFILFSLSLGFVLGSAAAANLDSLVGDWKIAVGRAKGRPRMIDLSVKKKEMGEGLSGSIKNQLGEAKIDDIKLEGESHVLHYTMQVREQQIAFKVVLKVSGDALAGTVEFGAGGPAMDLEGARVGSESEKTLLKAIEDAKTLPADQPGKSGQAAKPAGNAGEPPTAPTLPIADAGDFVGEWTLKVESDVNGTERAAFVVKEQDGKVTAQLQMPEPIGEQTINNIVKTEKGLNFKYPVSFGSQEFKVTLALVKEGERLTGKMSDESGLFELPVTGVRKGSEAPPPAEAALLPRRRQSTGQTAQATASVKVGDNKILVIYGRPSTSDPGNNRIPFTAPEGSIWRMGKDSATKMKTETDLLAGDKTIKPGRYSLWAKKVGPAWSLVINEKPDVWGTQHDPGADIAEVPLEISRTEAPVEKMTIELSNENGEVTFLLKWGTDAMKAKVKAVSSTAAASN